MTFDKLVKPTILATAVFLALSAIVVTLLGTGVMPVQANDPSADAPSISISLTPSDTVRQGTEIAVNLTMRGLEPNLDTSTLMYKFRADVIDHDSCESNSGWWPNGISLVDDEPERRWVTVSPDCPVGNYTINATLSDSLDNELDTASATFSVVEPSLPTGSSIVSNSGFVGNPCTEEGTASMKEVYGIDFLFLEYCREDTLPFGESNSEADISLSSYHYDGPHNTLRTVGLPQTPTLSAAVSGNSITLAWSYWFARGTSRYSTGGMPDSFIIEKTWTDANGQTSSTEISVPYVSYRLAAYDFYTDTSVVEGVPYEYTITGLNQQGKGETSRSVTATLPAGSGSSTAPTSAPSAPTNLDASVTDEGIALSWNAPDDSVFGYEVRRRIPELADGGMRTYVDFTHKTSLVDAQVDLAAPYRYEYVVSAININGVGESTDKVAISPASTCATDYSNMPAPTSRPDAPGNLTAAQQRSGGIALRWDAPADPTVSSYLILRRSLREQNYQKDSLYIVGRTFCKTDTSYLDSSAEDQAHYRYRVRATNDFEQGGISWWSNVADLVTYTPADLDLGTNTPASGTPSISGTVQLGQTLAASTTGITDPDGTTNAFYIYQWIANDGTSDSDIADATASTYTLVAADAGKTIKVKVTFTDDGGHEETLTSDATTELIATVPGAPGNLSVSVNDTDKLDVSWDAPESNGGSAVTGYRVQWKAAANSWDTPADVSETTVTGTSHTVTGLTDGVEYTFRVFAVNTVGDSSASEDESGTPRETTAPTVLSATVDGATLTLTFSEGLTETPLPAVRTFTVYSPVGATTITIVIGVDSVAISGSTVTVTLSYAVPSTYDTWLVSYTVPSDPAAARLKDLSDNPVASFTGQAVTNNTAAARTPLTASIPDEPSSHDGQSEFTFELQFSEEPKEDFSENTLRDHAFTVTGGEVKGARSLVSGSNVRWEITINPASNGDVTIVLPITTDCTDNGAVCTGDGTKLSNRLDLTVSGPAAEQSSQQQQENSAATGSPTISGTAQVGETLSASTTGITDPDGLTNASYSYQWIANDGTSDSDIADATASAYTLVAGDAGKTIKVKVIFTDDNGNDESLTSTATTAVIAANTSATGAPTISGTVQVDQTLTADTSGIGDADGLTNVSYSYQWIANDGTSDSDIADATSSSYTLVAADAGKTIKVKVAFTDDAQNQETGTSAATAAVAAAVQTPLTASIHSEPASHDGQDAFTFELHFSENLEGFSYKTLRDHAFTVTGGKVATAGRLVSGNNTKWRIKIGPTSNGDVTIVLPITTDCADNGAVCNGDSRKLSNRLELTVSGPGSQQSSQQQEENSPATGNPTISGTAQVGETLTASTTGITDADRLTNVSYSYQWIANDGSSDSDIADATASAYTLVAGDAGKTIKVKVSFTDDGGDEETLTSAPTAAVAATVSGAPGSLSVSVNDTGKLDVSWSVPGSNGGSSVTGYRVQWKEAADSWDTPADVSETTVTGTNHTVTGLTDGVEYTFRVFAVNSAGDGSASEDESGTPRETSAPTVSSGTVDGATLTLTFSEGLTETPRPAVATFTVNVGGNQRGVNTVAISGSTVTLTLASAVTSTDDVSVGYTVPSDAAAARLKDLSDNPAESFTGQAVTNNTTAAQTPLTASIHDEAISHDGQKEFTFELRFSENLEGFSYKTLRDNAFTVTGGRVEGARRLDPPSNIEWQIKIRPTSNGDVTIVLPITEDCTADGAVCTGDRKLSNRLEIIVSGPNG